MTWDEIEDWRQYHRQDEWGESRQDQRASVWEMIRRGQDTATGVPPNTSYPYFTEAHDPEALYKLLKKQDAERAKQNGR